MTTDNDDTVSIEHYARAQATLMGGVVELGGMNAPGKLALRRSMLLAVKERIERSMGTLDLSDDDAIEDVTANADGYMVEMFGDVPRFVEVWRGRGDDVDPVTQVYKPFGMPRHR